MYPCFGILVTPLFWKVQLDHEGQFPESLNLKGIFKRLSLCHTKLYMNFGKISFLLKFSLIYILFDLSQQHILLYQLHLQFL